MSDPLPPLDLKFLPDWLKEAPSPNRYAGHDGDSGDRSFGGRERRGPRPGGSGGGAGGGQGRRDSSRPASRGPQGQGRDDRRQGQGGGGPRGQQGGGRREGGHGGQGGHGQRGGGGDRRDQRGRGPQHDGPREPRAENAKLPAEIRVEFLPEPNAAAHIARQIRQSARAYPLFGTARMFLEKPERHLAKITSKDAAHPLHQLSDGPIGFDASLLERDAFRTLWRKYYREESQTVDAPKGNYTSVARCRSTGQFLGPTNHHAYQVAVRRLYEERFSRRMSFVEFQREEVEVVTSEQAVEDWKAQCSKLTVYITLNEAEPLQFKTLAETEAHFRKHYLPTLMKSASVLECSGRSAREMPERALTHAAREAFDKELAYPSSVVNGLRHYFNEEGLQVFKHRKRVLYVSAIRPKRADASQSFADGPATLLKVIEEHPRITKRDLAIRILGAAAAPATPEATAPEATPQGEAAPATEPTIQESPEYVARKTQLAADLHYLVHSGFVVEFSDGKLDLPLAPNQQNAQAGSQAESDEADASEATEEHSEQLAEHAEHAADAEHHAPASHDAAHEAHPDAHAEEEHIHEDTHPVAHEHQHAEAHDSAPQHADADAEPHASGEDPTAHA